MRFDYGGTGDSAGDGGRVSLREWTADLATAIEEVRRRSGMSRVALVGQRLGASLAWSAATQRGDVDLLVLWDPIVHCVTSEFSSVRGSLSRNGRPLRAARRPGIFSAFRWEASSLARLASSTSARGRSLAPRRYSRS
jgi:pimeloyl-ACP methyl ester carboxylesterase